MEEIILSVIIISHNQRDELRRCVDSVIAQSIGYTYEIIISDDNSSDGTYELAQQYADSYSFVTALRCNSNDCNPPTNSQRSGYNRCLAYHHAQGKYIAHVDADDYFRPGSNVYSRQIEALEKHPECSLAMSNCVRLKIGQELSEGEPCSFPRKMKDGELIEPEEFIGLDFFRINQCFMQRRNQDVDPVALYGYRYVDAIITYHHLQFGKVVFVDACDYVYVISNSSIGVNTYNTGKDVTVLWCLGLYIPHFIPKWTRLFYMGSYYDNIRRVIALARTNYKMLPMNFEGIRDLHDWIYDCFDRDLKWVDYVRLDLTDLWMRFIKKTGIDNKLNIGILRILLTEAWR